MNYMKFIEKMLFCCRTKILFDYTQFSTFGTSVRKNSERIVAIVSQFNLIKNNLQFLILHVSPCLINFFNF